MITDISTLRQKSRLISIEESESLRIFDLLIEELQKHPNVVGLSAIQIGIPVSAIIVKTASGYIKMLNPVVVESCGSIIASEGCLSFPGQSVRTIRHEMVVVKDDINIETKMMGFDAIVVQHEIDHCNGLTMHDRAATKIKLPKIGRNDPCPCGRTINGSPIKYKRCCGK